MWEEIVTAIVTSTATTAVILTVLGFFGRSIIEGWFKKDLEKYKSGLALSNAKDLERLRADLQIKAFEYQTRFASLHQERARVLDKLYKSLSKVEHNLILAIQNTHLDAEDSRSWEEKKVESEEMYKKTLEAAIQFESDFHENRHYLSENLCKKLEGLAVEFSGAVQHLATTHLPSPSDVEGPGPAILALWDVEKRVRVIIPPIKQEIEEKFRKILGVGENEPNQ